MAATGPLSQAQKALGSFTSHRSSNTSMFLEKTKLNARRSTPDSEALASSDDEEEQLPQTNPPPVSGGPRPARRSSWLNEVPTVSQRKGSFATASTFSPTDSHPNTPGTDTAGWGSPFTSANGSALGRVPSNSASYPWGTAIWNPETRREPPSRLAEVLPSPTTGGPTPQGDEGPLNTVYQQDPEGSLPFAIPLHPTPKTYRSQSYSVGQLDPDSTNSLSNQATSGYFTGRSKPLPSPALKQRSSRSGIDDGPILSRVYEVHDDTENTNSPEQGVRIPSSHSRTMEQLTIENALLRHAMDSGIRNRAASMTLPSGALPNRSRGPTSGIPGSVPEEVEEEEHALEESDDLSEMRHVNRRYAGRRYSEYNVEPDSLFTPITVQENHKLDSMKKNQWHTSLGFGPQEGSQSRRHSFADVPTRHTSFSSDQHAARGDSSLSQGLGHVGVLANPGVYGDLSDRPQQAGNTSYFSGLNVLQRGEGVHSPAASPQSAQHPLFPSQSVYGRPSSPPSASYRQPYGIPQQNSASSQFRTNQLLYVVTFKCCRAEVFYVQEGVGLQVKPGDLVIVEADRGTDLGTVAHANVSWEKAKELKEHYAQEHYKWLMMFSRHGQAGNTERLPPSGLKNATAYQSSAIGGMGPPPTTQQMLQEPSLGELRPKMIKRLAQNHEIQTLRDKEGNEAKAKRICQQKVTEHRLNMEILDAEFQMDWKKLTFYYFADSYINFNSLVTDLFKVYKTRIWMSAINPASFATPAAGPQPSGVGIGSFDGGSSGSATQRQGQEGQAYNSSSLYSTVRHQESRLNPSREQLGQDAQSFVDRYGSYPYLTTPQSVRQGQQYSPEVQQEESFSTYSPINYDSLISRFPAQYSAGTGQEPADIRTSHALSDPWLKGFQGLSLGSQ